MLRTLRIVVLLFVLATVVQFTWLERRRVVEWSHPLRVVVYPIDADRTAATRAYLDGLDRHAYADIEAWFADQAAQYGLALARPVEIALGPRVERLPPPVPRHAGMAEALSWSLRMRFWAWRNDDYAGPKPHVRLFVVHHDPARSQRLAHSTGLAKGMIGVVHVFAAPAQQASNNVVIAHELLHTFGATDKYDFASNMPHHPDGYADPHAQPRFPQRQAEIMGGRIARSPVDAQIPASLAQTVLGARTAIEIHWR